MSGLNEREWEIFALETLAELAWETTDGTRIAPGSGERESWAELIIPGRLRNQIKRINPQLPLAAVDEIVDLLLTPKSLDAKAENRRVHEYLTKGVRSVVYTDAAGAERNPTIHLIDRLQPYNNDFLAVQQVRIVEGEANRRFDIVLYLNGLPVGIVELKKASDKQATPEAAHAQLVTYLEELPRAFRCNVLCLISDGVEAKYGTVFTPFNHFAPWNVNEDGEPVSQPATHWADSEFNLTLHGLFEQRRFIELLGGYVAFAQTDEGLLKRIAKPHQYFAVSKAIDKTIEAVRSHGMAGVIWHTQGSGKSLEMELYAAQAMRHPSLGNPTIVVLTDRTELDDQLFDGFVASELLPEKPRQVTTREELRTELSNRTTGGIYFTTLQKFGRTKEEKDRGDRHPVLSERRNIIVIVDEAHRSHYDNLRGYARHLRDALPYATMIAFTGTPISDTDRDTRKVFGDYIDVYDLTRAVDDGATVPVYYQSRHIPLSLAEGVDAENLDEEADRVTTGLDDAERERIQQAVAAMNVMYGAPDRIEELAADIVTHWEARSQEMRPFIDSPGKGMIVCATREICAKLYEQIIALKPDWHSKAPSEGKIKVVFSGDPSDTGLIKEHVRKPSAQKAIKNRMKNVDDELELIIVKDMLLTGFDAPSLHTLYLDRPMRGALLMQTLARVNRTFRNKQDGLLVGYAPITDDLYAALEKYTTRGNETKPLRRDLDDAIIKVRDLVNVLGDTILAGYAWRVGLAAKTPHAYRDTVLGAVNYLRDPLTPGNQVEDPKDPTLRERFRRESSRLARFWALCSSSGELNEFRDDIAFFAEIRVWMAKYDAAERQASGQPVPADVELYLRQLTAGAVEAGGVTDLFEAAGMPRPNLAHLDEAFLAKMKNAKHPQLAIEALRRLIEQEMRKVTKHNVVRQQSFSDRLIALMRKYTNQHLTAAQIIAELVEMAREVSADADRGKRFVPVLNPDELAFYDAVSQNESAVNVMGEGVLADIARDLVKAMKRDITTDWVSRDDVRAKLRSTIKRLLAKHGYPPDLEPTATELVLNQMETFADEWSPQA
ncbi:DEAD/DEAH box helicase [Microtetraspora sp. NBRC 13810]|uniref:type I restriction endonuclease subunit R n=1 Tax=Microtetraspora sp. NBRC 13810 TaxID=3030990 RepID=UPI0024A27308|nr:type I restriction endonuclease subunit R [Microtetraspora sp. NBRC 13810]GLW08731.1 DEAD/DEAH box helicase [Microtetraspora sp. NBRC 13810]